MATKQLTGLNAPDGSQYVTIVDGAGNLAGTGVAGFPAGSTPISAVFSGADTTTAAATLAAAAGKTTYISGFTVAGLGSTAGGPVTVTVSGLVGGTTQSYSYVYTASATTPNTPLQVTFNQAIPGNAVNTAIVVTVPGQAGNTATQINAWGFQA
jgi:hypothetical protein